MSNSGKDRTSMLRHVGLRRRHLGLPFIRSVIRPFTKAGLISEKFVAGAETRTNFVIKVQGRQFRYVLHRRDPLGSKLYWRSWAEWEFPVVTLFARWVQGARRILDIGAYTGFYTLLAAANGSDVVAFEPNPESFGRLQENVRLNHFESACILLNLAAASQAGEIPFYLHDEDPTSCSVVRVANRQITVKCNRVDVVVPTDQRTDLVKLDVEGFEDQALYGMEALFAASHPKIIFECFRKSTAPVVEALLKDLGYKLGWISEDASVVPIERIVVEKYGHGWHNFAAYFS